MSRSHLQHKHRFDPELKELLQKAATANGRSLTAEINFRLAHSFDDGVSQPSSVSGTPEAPSSLPTLLAMAAQLDDLCLHLGVIKT